MDSIPVIDIAPFRNGSAQQQQAVAKEVADACASLGFLIVSGHGVADSLIDDMRKVSFAYFDQPVEDKIKLRMPPDRYRGYISLGSEALAYSLDEETPPDFKELFSIGPVDPPDDGYHRAAGPGKFFAPNLWPDTPSGFRPVWETYYREMERVATTLMQSFALGLGMDKHYFDDKVDRHITNFSVLHYPEQPKPPLPGQLRAGAHTDYGSLTILKPDNAPGGLQVQNKDGAWIDVPTLPGTFIVNLGDLMAEWTNDRWVSTLHRVDQSAARPGGGQPPAVDGVLPSAELRRHDRMPADLLGRKPAAALWQDHVGRACLDEDQQAPHARIVRRQSLNDPADADPPD